MNEDFDREFYLDLTGTEQVHKTNDLSVLATRIREHVLDATRISVSIGGGTTRIVAKLAAKKAKPAGTHVVAADAVPAFMHDIELAAIPGIGPKFQEKLRSYGLIRVADVLSFDEKALTDWFGESTGPWLYERIRGIDNGQIEPRGVAKSISRDETFSHDLTQDDALLTELARLAGAAASDLRSRGLRARTVAVKVRDPDFTTRQARHTLNEGLESDRAIYDVARELLLKLRKARRGGVRLLGVSLAGFTDQHGVEQLGLFGATSPVETEKDRQLSRVVDNVRNKFGADAIVSGRAMPQ